MSETSASTAFPALQCVRETCQGPVMLWSDVRTPDFAFQGTTLAPRGFRKSPVLILWRPANTPGAPLSNWLDSLLVPMARFLGTPDFDIVDLGPIEWLHYRAQTTVVRGGEVLNVLDARSSGQDRLELLARQLDMPQRVLLNQLQMAVDKWGPACTVEDTWPLAPASQPVPARAYTADELRHLRICHAHLSPPLFADWLGVSVDEVHAWESADNASGALSPTGAVARFLAILGSRGRAAVGLL